MINRNDAERNITLLIFGYETLALLPGSPLPPITRVTVRTWPRMVALVAVLIYHLARHRQALRYA